MCAGIGVVIRMKEHRTIRRYDLFLPVVVRIRDENEVISWTGKTRDISTRGVYFTIDCDRDLNPGVELDLMMTLPAEVTGGSEALIRATGKVLRVDGAVRKGARAVGVAAMFESHETVRNEAGIA